jgi:hypothetical protein
MATYTSAQLHGTGSIGENLSGSKTFTFTNPSASSYFVLETLASNLAQYDNTSPTCALGTWVTSASMGFVSSPYIAGVVVQPGGSSLTFTPISPVTGSNYRLRGTGEFSLTIS